jgi:hypothetical protein
MGGWGGGGKSDKSRKNLSTSLRGYVRTCRREEKE